MSLNLKLDVYSLENYLVCPDPSALAENQQHTLSGNQNRNAQKGNVLANPRLDVKLMKTAREKLLTLRKRCADDERVESVEGVLLVHLHRHPHVLLLKQRLSYSAQEGAHPRIIPTAASNASEFAYRLPGGRCRKGEKPEDCLLRKLSRQLLNAEKAPPLTQGMGPTNSSDTIVDVGASGASASPTAVGGGSTGSSCFRVGEILGKWYRPHLNLLIYPYVPPHISPDAVKEVRTMFLVHMERSIEFQVPHANVELVAVPLFDLYDNTGKYSPDIVSLPIVLSRVFINCCSNVEF